MILDMLKAYYFADKPERQKQREEVRHYLEKVGDSSGMLRSLLMETVMKIIDEHPEDDVINILRHQPDHVWWYDLFDSMLDAERIFSGSDWDKNRAVYAEMSAEVFELTLLGSEAKYTIYDLLGYEKGPDLLKRLDRIINDWRKVSKTVRGGRRDVMSKFTAMGTPLLAQQGKREINLTKRNGLQSEWVTEDNLREILLGQLRLQLNPEVSSNNNIEVITSSEPMTHTDLYSPDKVYAVDRQFEESLQSVGLKRIGYLDDNLACYVCRKY